MFKPFDILDFFISDDVYHFNPNNQRLSQKSL